MSAFHQLIGRVDHALLYVCMSLSGSRTLIDNQPIAFCSVNGLKNILMWHCFLESFVVNAKW